MKPVRLIFLLCLVLFAAFQAGCRTTWSVDFTKVDETEMDGWAGHSSWNLNDPAGSGLTVESWHVTSPVGFSADFTLNMELYMVIDDSNTAEFEIWIGDDDGEEPEHYISCAFSTAGDEENEYVLVHEDGEGLGFRDLDEHSPIPGLRSGTNYFKLDKRGNKVTIRLNNTLIETFDIMYYDAAASFVSFVTSEFSNVDVYYKKISVDYEGDIVPFS